MIEHLHELDELDLEAALPGPTMPLCVLICGTRDWLDEAPIRELIASLPEGSVLYTGDATGADSLARTIGRELLGEDGVRVFEADWERLGASAGPDRNRRMLEAAIDDGLDLVVAFRKAGRSPGTDGMIAMARERGVPTTVLHETGEVESWE